MGQLRQGAGDSRNFLGLDFSGDSGDLGEISWSASEKGVGLHRRILNSRVDRFVGEDSRNGWHGNFVVKQVKKHSNVMLTI